MDSHFLRDRTDSSRGVGLVHRLGRHAHDGSGGILGLAHEAEREFMIENNDPDNAWGKHTVELVFKEYEFSKTFVTNIGGNCHGLTVIESAVRNVFDQLVEALPDEDDPIQLTLEHPTKGIVVIEDDDGRDEDWLKDLLVSAVILSYTPKAEK